MVQEEIELLGVMVDELQLKVKQKEQFQSFSDRFKQSEDLGEGGSTKRDRALLPTPSPKSKKSEEEEAPICESEVKSKLQTNLNASICSLLESSQVDFEVDEEGFLVHPDGRPVIDDHGKRVYLTEENLQFLRDANILQEELRD